jgi:hypothetical protein
MKKLLIIIGICVVFLSMPVLTAFSTAVTKTTLETPPIEDYDGTFIGGIGRIFKEGEEWSFDTHGYLAGVYKEGIRFNRLYGYLYNLEEEQVGYIGAYFGHKIIIGYVEDMEENKAHIIGFLFYNDVNFAGRIMSFFGPAPHIWGEYTPN